MTTVTIIFGKMAKSQQKNTRECTIWNSKNFAR